ncbi:MAG: 16S rRNA (guanine(527)-N(7))-methyltransferase RsmG [Solirubrobacteraceae bacterium]|nr:MAG: 16S rRNA (guanine(527)-N(7))-methyltransferase RsmG [Solirubrobacterales bacterium]
MDPVAERRLRELAARYGFDGAALWKLAALLDALAGDDTAPTPIRDPARAVDAHVADSLSALELDPVREAHRIADLGAGAGFPGAALAAVLPHARVSLLESVGRKAAFLTRAVTAAGLTNVEVVPERVELWDAGHERFDLVTARALAPLAVIAEYAAPLLIHEGWLVAWKGRRSEDEEAAGDRAASLVGLAWREIRRVEPFVAAGERHLHLFQKIAPTPEGFPRRPGMARKRPLGREGGPLAEAAQSPDAALQEGEPASTRDPR